MPVFGKAYNLSLVYSSRMEENVDSMHMRPVLQSKRMAQQIY
jgi:hypothetical protein